MQEKLQTENKMGVMPVNKLLLSMAVPMIISMLVQALYNVVDSIFVSRISENALTAVSLAFPMQNLLISFAVGFGVGINALMSRALGEKDPAHASRIAISGMVLEAASYVIFLILGLFFTETFMRAQISGEVPAEDAAEIISHGVSYLRIVLIFSFGVFIEITYERILQSTGRTTLSMITHSGRGRRHRWRADSRRDRSVLHKQALEPRDNSCGSAPVEGLDAGHFQDKHPEHCNELDILRDDVLHEPHSHHLHSHSRGGVRRVFQAAELCVHARVRP